MNATWLGAGENEIWRGASLAVGNGEVCMVAASDLCILNREAGHASLGLYQRICVGRRSGPYQTSSRVCRRESISNSVRHGHGDSHLFSEGKVDLEETEAFVSLDSVVNSHGRGAKVTFFAG